MGVHLASDEAVRGESFAAGQRLYVLSGRLLPSKRRTCRTSSTDHRDVAR
jgi:hypothetical protein